MKSGKTFNFVGYCACEIQNLDLVCRVLQGMHSLSAFFFFNMVLGEKPDVL